MNSRQRAYLKGLAMNLDPIMQIGKASLTEENAAAIAEAMEPRELIKISVLKKKIVLYKQADEPKNRKINLPK